MPIGFLSHAQREHYGRYSGSPSTDELARNFHLDNVDLGLIAHKRGDHNRLGFAVQLSTLRYLGTFLDDPLGVPAPALQTLTSQLYIESLDDIDSYGSSEQRWQHAQEIRARYGCVEITKPQVGWRLTRWLYALCWTGTDRPSELFERATTWLMTHKVLLPGCSTLERHVARLRSRVETRLWQALARACQMLLDPEVKDAELRARVFEQIPREALALALDGVNALIRPADNVYWLELRAKYRTLRRFLPTLLEQIRFGANAAGAPVVAALDWLRINMTSKKPAGAAPREVVGIPWQSPVLRDDGAVDLRA